MTPRLLRRGHARWPLYEARFEFADNPAHYRTIRGRARNEREARELFGRRQAEQFPGEEYPLARIDRLKG
jgi:hypothetical protein